MSRRRLREELASGMSSFSSTSSSVRSSGTRPNPVIAVNESYLTSDYQPITSTTTTTTTQNTVNSYGEFSDQEFEEPSSRLLGVHGLRMPASSTRSGKKYGQKWAPGSKEEQRARRRSRRQSRLEKGLEVDDDTGSEYSTSINDVASYRRFEKQLEYEGRASLYKERNLNHLYGLDHSDAEISDTETNTVADEDVETTPADVHTTHTASTLTTVTTAIYSWFSSAAAATSRHVAPGAFIAAANRAQRWVARTVVSDTWLLMRTSRLRRAYGCCCWIPLLILLPLLLTSAYYIYDRGLYSRPLVLVPVIPRETSPPPVAGLAYSDQELAHQVQVILVGLLREREKETRTIITQDWHAWAAEFSASQSATLASHRKDLEGLIAALVAEKVGAVAAGLDSGSKEEVASQMAFLADQWVTRPELDAIIKQSDDLRTQLTRARVDMNSEDVAVRAAGAAAVLALESKLDGLGADLRSLQNKHGALAAAFKDCCKNDSAFALLIRTGVEEHLAAMLSGGGGGGLPMDGRGSSNPAFLTWLQNQFVNRNDMDSRLAALLAKIEDEIKATNAEATNAATLAAAAAAAAAAQKSQSSTERNTVVAGAVGGVSEKHVRTLIQQALLLYAADKTGQVDYALESAGGSVVSTRCSETYHRRTAQLSLFGIPLWYTSNSPRTVVQPDMQPGQCWAFKGKQGFLVIQLAGTVRPTAFTMEHIPKTLSPTGKIDSAPKDFSVYGLHSERDQDGVLLGNFTYRDDSEPLQTFTVMDPNVQAYPMVELQITDNHGNEEYTCLYRFRVHGVLPRD